MPGLYDTITGGIKTFSGWLTGGWWRPRGQAPRTLDEMANALVEKIRTGVSAGTLTFPPYVDDQTEETPEIRAEYRKMPREPFVKTGLLQKVLSVAARPMQVHPPDEQDPNGKEQADFIRHTYTRLPVTTRRLAVKVLYPALMDGWSCNEKKMTFEDQGRFKEKWVYENWKSKDTKLLRQGVDQYRNVVALQANLFNAGRLFDPDDYVLYAFLPLFENPNGTSDLRAAYRAYFSKKVAWQLRGQFVSKWGNPFLIASYPEGRNDVKRALEEALVRAKADTWLTVPIGTILQPLEMAARGTSDFESFLADCDKEILVALVGSYLQILEGRTTGARSMGEVHADTAALFEMHLAAELGDVLTAEARMLLRWNYPNPVPITVTLGGTSEEELLQRSQVDLNLQQCGLPLSKREMYRIYGRSEPVDADDALLPPTAAPLPAAPFDDGLDGPPAIPFPQAPGGLKKLAGDGQPVSRNGHGRM